VELPFAQQVWLSVIDKGLLALATLFIGAIATRALERYKARQALHHVVAGDRLRRIAQLHEELMQLDADVDRMRGRLELRQKERTQSLTSLEEKAKAWFDVVNEANPEIAELLSRAEALEIAANKEVFWLGRDRAQWLIREIGFIEAQIGLLALPSLDEPAKAPRSVASYATNALPGPLKIRLGVWFLKKFLRRRPSVPAIDEVIDRLTR
jgi:hypothetical protein